MEPSSVVLKSHPARVVETNVILKCGKETQEEVRLWFYHLFEVHERRKSGALKAAETKEKER